MDISSYPSYSVAIRTLGTAGEKYYRELVSIDKQTIAPQGIFVYIPHGYLLPQETIGKETYVRCEKGMMTQRSFAFNEITSEYILFLDDDLELPSDFVQKLFDGLSEKNGDCISPDIYQIHNWSWKKKLTTFLRAGVFPHFDSKWAVKKKRDNQFMYNNSPKEEVLLSESSSFAAFLIKKKVYDCLHYEDERWIDRFQYSIGDDDLFFYKIHINGFRLLYRYNTGIVHLDAGSGHVKDPQKAAFNTVFLRHASWYRIIYSTQPTKIHKIYTLFLYFLSFFKQFCIALLSVLKNRNFQTIEILFSAKWQAYKYCHSEEFQSLRPYKLL